MSGPAKNTTAYSASDIQRYLKGEMSAREMHDLEKAALEDPFLADALEGFEKQLSPTPAQAENPVLSGHISEHLDDLRTWLDSRVTDDPAHAPKVIPTPAPKIFGLRAPWMRIAAAAVLIIGLCVTAWYGLLKKSKQPDLANMDIRPVTVPVDTHKAARSNAESPIGKAEPTRPAPISGSAPLARSAPRHKTLTPPADLAEKRAVAPTPSDSTAIVSANLVNIQPRASTIKKDTVSYEERAQAYSAQTFAKASKNRADIRPLVFSGKVLDVHNNPLSGATLYLAGLSGNNAIGAVTDMNGNFSLKVHPRDSVLRVTVGMVGYQQTSLAFNTLNTEASSGNLIYLQQQPNALDEVVVSGFGAKRKETRALPPSPGNEKIDSLWIDARPVIGKQAYLDYLAAGKKILGADTSVKGTVIISFDVTKKGELTSFKVEQSLTPAHDTGLIHLISDGPAWKKLSKGQSVRAAVRVVF